MVRLPVLVGRYEPDDRGTPDAAPGVTGRRLRSRYSGYVQSIARALALLLLLGCGSTSGLTSDGGRDADGAGTPLSDLASDGGPDAEDADASAGDASCPSLDSFCTGPRCVTDWATAQDPSTWCSGPRGYITVYIATDCGGFNFVYVRGVDYGTVYFYDPQSGQLVGVGGTQGAEVGPFEVSCAAGVVPQQPISVQCGDGGATIACTF
jgi:hypothetical protein